jgi:hypothetical protein
LGDSLRLVSGTVSAVEEKKALLFEAQILSRKIYRNPRRNCPLSLQYDKLGILQFGFGAD